MGEFEEGFLHHEAMKISPSDSEVWNHKGIYFYSLRQYDEAIKCFSRATDLDPKNANAWYNKGGAMEDLGKKAEADEAYARAKEMGFNGTSAIFAE